MRRRVFPVLVLGWLFSLEALAAGATLMCQGRLSQATRDTGQTGIEFTLEYAEGMQVATFKSNFEAINGPLTFQLDDAFLRARQAQPRPLGTEGRSIGVSELRVSRNTGQFSLAVALYRDIDLPDGGALWEGDCRPREVADKKF
jgi:hypothetical protein